MSVMGKVNAGLGLLVVVVGIGGVGGDELFLVPIVSMGMPTSLQTKIKS
jgi:hypothetical protein